MFGAWGWRFNTERGNEMRTKEEVRAELKRLKEDNRRLQDADAGCRMGTRLEAVIKAIEESQWMRIDSQYGQSWRYGEWVKTPKTIIELRIWQEPTHERRVWLMIIGRKVLLRIDRCPWLACRDISVTNTRALEVIRKPEEAFS